MSRLGADCPGASGAFYRKFDRLFSQECLPEQKLKRFAICRNWQESQRRVETKSESKDAFTLKRALLKGK
jgi:hypothetical protein